MTNAGWLFIAKRCTSAEAIPHAILGGRYWIAGTAMHRQYYVYMMSNPINTVLYSGLTNDLRRRAKEHKLGAGGEFTRKYNACRLVYYEVTSDVKVAIAREKQIKAGSRQKKVDLVNTLNPEWKDLADIE